MVKNKNKTVLFSLLISIIILSLIASTYAFVRTTLSNTNNFRASLKAGTMSLVFSDGSPGFNTQISLGGSVEKIFTIENTGAAETYATMSWRELQNTYTPGSLVYTLSESSDGGLTYTNRVSETPVPTSNTGLTIVENLTIPSGTTMYYKLTISYIFLEGVDQTQDLHAYINTLFTLEEGSFIDKAVLISKNNVNYWSSSDYKDKIKTASFVQGINVPSDAVVSWDMSTAGDGRVMAYLVNNVDSIEESPLYDLYIATDRMQIYANGYSAYLFSGLNNLIQFNNLEMLNTSNVTDMFNMFFDCKSLTNLDLSGFNTSNVIIMSYMFFNCTSLTNLDLSGFNTSNVTDMGYMFFNCTSLTNLDLSSFSTSNVTNMNFMFQFCSSLTNLDLSNFDTYKVTNMVSMFDECQSLINLDLSGFNTSNVIIMSYMFDSCSSLTNIDLSRFSTSNVTAMSGMFRGCTSLTNLDLSNFNTASVSDMSNMFKGCINLTSLDLSNFDTSNVTDMSIMFSACYSLANLNLSNFNTSLVTNMSMMFHYCTSLTNLDLSSFNVSNVEDAGSMFQDCNNLVTIYVSNNWGIPKSTNSDYVFTRCSKLVGGAGTTYSSSHRDITYAHVDGGPTNPGYLTLKV